MVGATRLTLMAERLAFVSISARPAPDGRAGRGAVDLDQRRPTRA